MFHTIQYMTNHQFVQLFFIEPIRSIHVDNFLASKILDSRCTSTFYTDHEGQFYMHYLSLAGDHTEMNDINAYVVIVLS
jgi:hypothetical protein